jgi:hypothetical protein
MAGDDNDAPAPADFSECVSQAELEVAREKMLETINKAVIDALIAMKLDTMLERVDRRVSDLTERVAVVEVRTQQPPQPPRPPPPPRFPDNAVFDNNGNYDEAATRTKRLQCHLRQNRVGMGGTPQGNNNRDDPYAKVKFTIPSFSGHYDNEGYLDWEMTVEQKFSAHLVPEQHQIR